MVLDEKDEWSGSEVGQVITNEALAWIAKRLNFAAKAQKLFERELVNVSLQDSSGMTCSCISCTMRRLLKEVTE